MSKLTLKAVCPGSGGWLGGRHRTSSVLIQAISNILKYTAWSKAGLLPSCPIHPARGQSRTRGRRAWALRVLMKGIGCDSQWHRVRGQACCRPCHSCCSYPSPVAWRTQEEGAGSPSGALPGWASAPTVSLRSEFRFGPIQSFHTPTKTAAPS